jgi:N-acetylmuramoyl-L-alanine amidase
MKRGNMMKSVVSLLIGLVLSLSACADTQYERVIVVDPGHGGVDSGAIGSTSAILEKDVTLRMALALRDQLEATGRYQVILTRDDDRTVQLCDRLQIARQSQGELLISIHADSLTTAPEVSGAAVYTLSDLASNEERPLLASKEQCAEIPAGIEPSNQKGIVSETVIDLASTARCRVDHSGGAAGARAETRNQDGQETAGAGGLRRARGARNAVRAHRARLPIQSG